MTTRRTALIGIGLFTGGMALGGQALAQPFVHAADFGLDGTLSIDQSVALQQAIDAATALSQPLYIPAGTYAIRDVAIGRPINIQGSTSTVLRLAGGESLFLIRDAARVVLESLDFDGSGGVAGENGLIGALNTTDLSITGCHFRNAAGSALRLHGCSGSVTANGFAATGDTAIFATDSQGLAVEGNDIVDCGNGGIRIWRYESGFDGTRVFGNRIATIDWRAGGNGQNGNGINIFRADGVSVIDNAIEGCSFSAIRLNATNNSRVTVNHCVNSGEIAIFSEFGFSGSIIADNIVDGAAGGISMTNFDHGGRLSICEGNIVRNIAARSETNPDTNPYGIAAEADALVTGNIIENVPGPGLDVGWGPYLRDVTASNNLIRNCRIGIRVSVAPEAGRARIADNVISGATEQAMIATRWTELASGNLAEDAEQFANLSVEGNVAH